MTGQTPATIEDEGRPATLDSPAEEQPSLGRHLPDRVARYLSDRFAPERGALTWWVLSRLAALWIAANAAWVFARDDNPVGPYLERWYTWDTQYFVKIAQHGYTEIPGDTGVYEAFFPGMPALLWIVHLVIPSWIVAGLLISFVAGGIAVMAMARLAEEEFGTGVGARAALLLCVSPLGVFLAAGYTESLFLAFAVPAWLQARRGKWAAAALLAAGASCVRITGVFLAGALIVEFLSTWLPAKLRAPAHPGAAPTRIWHAPWLAVPFLPVIAYFGYLKSSTGSWNYYFEAQKLGWGREYAGFVKTFHSMWNAAFTQGGAPTWQWAYRMEILSVAIGVALVIFLLAKLRYGEAVYVATSLVALTTSGMYFSTARATLLWWPLWIGLASLGAHPQYGKAITRVYLFLAVPIAVFLAAAFTTWRWAG
jgi:hypothetical protein